MNLTIDPVQVRHWCVYCPDLILEVEDAATAPDLKDPVGEQGFAHVDCATANGHTVEGAEQPDPADARFAIRQANRARSLRENAERAVEALRGPWIACLYDLAGFLVDIEEGDDYDAVEIAVVRDTAAPTGPDGDMRMPGTFEPADVLYRFEDFDSDEDVRVAWIRAQSVAEALNTREELGRYHALHDWLAENNGDVVMEASQVVEPLRKPEHPLPVAYEAVPVDDIRRELAKVNRPATTSTAAKWRSGSRAPRASRCSQEDH